METQSVSDKQNKEQERRLQDAEIRKRLGHIKNKILVMSGKGGVLTTSLPARLKGEKAPQIAPGERMIIAVPVTEQKLCTHFGHCEHFALVETENGKIVGKTLRTPPAHEPGVLPKWLHDLGVCTVIAGGMGSRAQQLFNEKGITLIIGAPMDSPESLVHQYLMNALVAGKNVCDD